MYSCVTGIGLTSTGLATVAGGLVGLLSVMGSPRLRQRIGSIGELADFRRYSRPRFRLNLLILKWHVGFIIFIKLPLSVSF